MRSWDLKYVNIIWKSVSMAPNGLEHYILELVSVSFCCSEVAICFVIDHRRLLPWIQTRSPGAPMIQRRVDDLVRHVVLHSIINVIYDVICDVICDVLYGWEISGWNANLPKLRQYLDEDTNGLVSLWAQETTPRIHRMVCTPVCTIHIEIIECFDHNQFNQMSASALSLFNLLLVWWPSIDPGCATSGSRLG